MRTDVGGLIEVVSWVLGFGRQAEVLEPEHLREAVLEEAKGIVDRYIEETPSAIYEDSQIPYRQP